MKTTKLTLIAIAAVIIAACSPSKKSSKSTASSTTASNSTTATTTTTTSLVSPKPANGIYAPGDEELTAIQVQYKDATLDKLKEGYILYTKGACVNCHGAMNIYKRGEERWKGIIDDMAEKAKISAEQKDAVYKYVLAIKATQPK